MSLRVAGVVLCGGHSRRMGTPKANLAFGRESLLERMVRILSERVAPVVVVTSKDQSLPALQSEVLVVPDRLSDLGPLAGLATGLAALGSLADAAFATSCDAPFLQPKLIERMIDTLGSSDLAIPVDGQYHHPLAAVYRVGIADDISSMLDNGVRRPTALLNHLGISATTIDVEKLRDVDPGLESFRNLNTPEDYKLALRDANLSPA